jgi:CubicO group peptidase (beta-lactamase class C family)
MRRTPLFPLPPRAALALSLFFLLAPLSYAQQSAPLPAEKIKLIEAAIAAEMSKQNIPGLSVAIVTDNQVRWSNGYGFADNSYKIAGGGFVSTVEDLAKIAIAVHTNSVLKRETVEQMLTSQKLRDGKETNYGLGWSV